MKLLKNYCKFFFIVFLLLSSGNSFVSQDFDEYIQKEFGFWLGGGFPAPKSPEEKIFNSSMSFGLFFRYHWPRPFHLELGTSFANYKSINMQQLTIIPLYVSLNYSFPIFTKFQLLGKLGLGASYLEIRPNNVNGWDPTFYLGFDFAIFASKRFKVGLRLDGYYIFDAFRDEPSVLKYLIYLPRTFDYRIQESLNYKNKNIAFYNFGLLFSFLY